MKSIIFTLTLSVLGSLLVAQEAPSPWIQDSTDIAADDAVTWGTLENGLRYAILPNSEPPNRVSLRLYVDAGSLMEEDNQQGLAHFLEHMAFNGTKNYPAGEMVEYFQRLGMAFGSHTNAHTSFKETVYKLELPETKQEMVDDGFRLLRDYADGLLLGQQEIDKERGVILSEKRSRDSADWRSFVDWIGFSLPEGRLSRRLPIGTEEVISGATRERFVEFYEKWYTADRMMVVVVGGIDVPAMETMVKDYFADLRTASPRVPDPDMGTIPDRGIIGHHHHDKEASDTEVSIETVRPNQLGKDSQARRKVELLQRMASSMLSQRLEIVSKKEGSPLVRASTNHSDLFNEGFAEYASIDASCEPGQWKESLAVIEQELRKALEFGFTDSELEQAKANFRVAIQNQAKSAPTRKSSQLANGIVSRIGSRRVFTHPDDDVARVTPLLDEMTTASCLEVLRNIWGDRSQIGVIASGNVVIEGGAEEVLSVYRSSLSVPVQAPDNQGEQEFAYGNLSEPGEVVKREEATDLGITQIQFANNVRANFKVTDFEKDKISVQARIGSGSLSAPSDQEGLSLFAGSIMNAGGLEAHSADDLQRLLAGKTVGAGFSVGEDAFVLSGGTNRTDLVLQLQLMKAALLHPGYREEAERQFDKNLDSIYNQLAHNPSAVMSNQVARLIHSGDQRFGYPERATLEARTIEEVKTWLTPHLRNDYLEISVVGDFDLDSTINAVAQTFGALPTRAEEKPAHTAARDVKFPEGTTQQTFDFVSQIPKSMVLVYWPTADMSDIKRTRRLGLLSTIFRDRLRKKVREELGDAYSPYARNSSSETYTGYGYLFALIEAAPDQADKLLAVIQKIGADLATGDISEDELERAKKPMLTMIEEYRRTNGYWMGSVLAMSQEYPERLDWARGFVGDYEGISKDELNELASKFLGTDKSLPVLISPKTE